MIRLTSLPYVLLLQLIYRPDNGEILGVHVFGLHAADLIHEASNAMALGTRIQVRIYNIIYVYGPAIRHIALSAAM